MSFLADILASSGLGAILGLAGSWLAKHEDRRTLALKLDHDLKLADIRKGEAAFEFEHELAMADKDIERTQGEGHIARDIETIAAFRDSLKAQNIVYGTRWVDAIRGLMRPLITVYLLILATFVTIRISASAGGLANLEQSAMATLYNDIISQIFFLATTAVTWWFGSRPTRST